MSHAEPEPAPWASLMREAIQLSLNPAVGRSVNPRVGCVIVDPAGNVIGRGWHAGAGTAHAEVVALAAAGSRARGATAVVTLEPCNHTGRTGPCSEALLEAGISRVVYACSDPDLQAAGGADRLGALGVEVVGGVLEDEAFYANRAWFHWQRTGRPLITAKMAVSLDGRVADSSGGPTPITGSAARMHTHSQRAIVDAIIVGTGTVIADDPQLTARDEHGVVMGRQPLRVLVGQRKLPDSARVFDDSAQTLVVRSRDVRDVVTALTQQEIQHALLEGGPKLTAAFLDAGLVDEVMWYVAPMLIGDGPVALPGLRMPEQVHVRAVTVLGDDVLVEGVVSVHGNS